MSEPVLEEHHAAAVECLRAHGLELEEHAFAAYAASRAAHADEPDGSAIELWTSDSASRLARSDRS